MINVDVIMIINNVYDLNFYYLLYEVMKVNNLLKKVDFLNHEYSYVVGRILYSMRLFHYESPL